MLHESWHVLWVICGVTGALSLTILAFAVVFLLWVERPWLALRRPPMPLFLLRVWTWRRRRRLARDGSYAPPDPDRPLSDGERVVWAPYERELR